MHARIHYQSDPVSQHLVIAFGPPVDFMRPPYSENIWHKGPPQKDGSVPELQVGGDTGFRRIALTSKLLLDL
jgi:hypothetical protein